MTPTAYYQHFNNFWTIRKTKKVSHQASYLYFALLDELSKTNSSSITLTDDKLKDKTGIVWIEKYRQELIDINLVKVASVESSIFSYSIINNFE